MGLITLNYSIDWYLILYTHLHIGFLLGGREVRLQELYFFFSRASISFSIASHHNGHFTTWEKVLGSSIEKIVERNPMCASEKFEREIY